MATEPIIIQAPGGPRLVDYGDFFARFRPRRETTPWLERFLYGPRETGNRRLRNPQGIAVFGDTLWVCDQGVPDVLAISLTTGAIRPATRLDDRPVCPLDVAADQAGRIYVADATRGAVLIYDENGRLQRELGGGDQRPCSLLWHDGILYLATSGGKRIQRYDAGADTWLTPVAPPPGAAPLIAPTGLAMSKGGVLLVADAAAAVVYRIALDDRTLPPLGERGRGPGQFVRPKHVAVTPSGRIAVADAGRQSVLFFEPDGSFIGEVGGAGDGGGRGREGLTLPSGLAVLTGSPAAGGAWAEDPAATGEAEYVLVSDSLGGVSLTLIGIERDSDACVTR